jgi:hypothetical protein
LTAGASVAESAAGWAAGDLAVAVVGGVVAAIAIVLAARLDRRARTSKLRSSRAVAGLPAHPASS